MVQWVRIAWGWSVLVALLLVAPSLEAHVAFNELTTQVPLTPGEVVQISWRDTIPHQTTGYDLEFMLSPAASPELIAQLPPDVRSFDWQVPDVTCGECRLHVVQVNTDADYADFLPITIGVQATMGAGGAMGMTSSGAGGSMATSSEVAATSGMNSNDTTSTASTDTTGMSSSSTDGTATDGTSSGGSSNIGVTMTGGMEPQASSDEGCSCGAVGQNHEPRLPAALWLGLLGLAGVVWRRRPV